MEIFMRDINYSVTQNRLITELANILHGPRYSRYSSAPLNFHIYLFKDKRGSSRSHRGCGVLTLPSEDIGLQFLKEYGDGSDSTHSCLLSNRRIRFSRSDREPRNDILESIARRPYLDPKVLEQKERIEKELASERVSVSTIQFGWECRDSVFSAEWEQSFEQCFITFDDDRRELRVKIPRPLDSLAIAIRFFQITTISCYISLSGEPVIYMILSTPPTYEIDSTHPRKRLSALPLTDHERVAPYVSLAIRLICSSSQELTKFHELSKLAQLHSRIYDTEYYAEYRGLFSEAVASSLRAWLRPLNWCIAFQVELLLRNLWIDMTELLSLMPHIVRLRQEKGKRYTASMLSYLGPALECAWSDPQTEDESILECFFRVQEGFEAQSNAKSLSSLQPTDGSLFDAYHVEITPTSMHLTGPHPERSNRVIRRYHSDNHESFLRVSFVEEGRLQYRFDRDVDGPAFIQSRVGPILLKGLKIAGRHFRFLAYSQSALKEHAVWFVKPFRDAEHGYIDASAIIKSIGSFDNLTFDANLMFCPARYGARISQAFTATDASVTIEDIEEIFPLDDIKTANEEYCFTDGVGTMSKELAVKISHKLKSQSWHNRLRKGHAEAVQIRFRGSKGMLSVDHTLRGSVICLRPSMIKFEDLHSREIEIAHAFDKPGPYFLNRPLIMLLENLGVQYEVFKAFQDSAVQVVENSTHSLVQAAKMFETHGLGSSYRLTSLILGLGQLGVDNLYHDPFYHRTLDFAIHHALRLLKNHARIPIPDAWTLVGVADVHKFLKEGEIFACIKPPNGQIKYLNGLVLISRSPTIHPGDVQIAKAIGSPPEGSCFSKEPLANTVVFSVLGSRPLPSCLGGGDLDGDVYNIIPLDTHPEFYLDTCEPAIYPPATRKLLNRPSTMDDVAEFVMEYINSDVVGLVAINWLILADQSPEGIFDRKCLELSALHSDAVDYPKSGNPVALERIPGLRFRERPDWNAPETVNPDSVKYYPSNRAIGRLFRDIQLPTLSQTEDARMRPRHRTKEKAVHQLSRTLNQLVVAEEDEGLIQNVVEARVAQFVNIKVIEADETMVEDIQLVFHRYVNELTSICNTHTLSYSRSLTEEEAVVGTIIQKTSQPRQRQDSIAKLRERTNILVRGMREELRGANEELEGHLKDYLKRSWMAWHVSISQGKLFGAQSFGWVALGAILDAVKEIENEQLEDMRNRFY